MPSEDERVAELQAQLRAEQSARRLAEIKEGIVRRARIEATQRIRELEAEKRAVDEEARRIAQERDEARTALLQARSRLDEAARQALESPDRQSSTIAQLRRDIVRRSTNLGRLEQRALALAADLTHVAGRPSVSREQLHAVRESVAARMTALDALSSRIEELQRMLRAAGPAADDTLAR